MWEKLWDVSAGYSLRFPDGNDPFQIMTRLMEKRGELAQEVNHFERTGIRREKNGEPAKSGLSSPAHCRSPSATTCVRR